MHNLFFVFQPHWQSKTREYFNHQPKCQVHANSTHIQHQQREYVITNATDWILYWVVFYCFGCVCVLGLSHAIGLERKSIKSTETIRMEMYRNFKMLNFQVRCFYTSGIEIYDSAFRCEIMNCGIPFKGKWNVIRTWHYVTTTGADPFYYGFSAQPAPFSHVERG